jgi:hypothetical protein
VLKDKNNEQIKTGGDDIEVQIKDPDNKVQDCDLVDLNNGTYKIRFVPQKVGIYKYTISVLGTKISEKPYETTVKNCKPDPPVLFYRTMNVKLCDEEGNVIEEENTKDLSFLFTTADGEVTDNIVIKKKYIGNGVHKISYVLLHPGDYHISVFVSKEHLSGSPFKLSY